MDNYLSKECLSEDKDLKNPIEEYCSKEMDNVPNLDEESIENAVCALAGNDVAESRRHKDQTAIKKMYSCSQCSFVTRKKRKFRAHWSVHQLHKFKCDICEKEFTKMSTLKRHQLTHTDKKYYLCDLCGRSYLHHISLKYHKMGHLKNNPIAGERTKYIQEKRRNAGAGKPSQGPQVFLCDLCGKVFKQANSLKCHRLKHQVDTDKGEEHSATSNVLIDLDYEEYLNKKRPGPKRKHPVVTEKKKFKCSECPYAAARSRDVVVHLRTHTGEKPFYCDICGKFFSKESVLGRHKLIHGANPKSSSANGNLSMKHANLANISNKTVPMISNADAKNYNSLAIKNEYVHKDDIRLRYFHHNEDWSFSKRDDPALAAMRKFSVSNFGNNTDNTKFLSENVHFGMFKNCMQQKARLKVDEAKSNSKPLSYFKSENTVCKDSGVEGNLKQVPHVVRIDGKEMSNVKKSKKPTANEQADKAKRVKGVRKLHKCGECPYETYLSRDLRVHARKHSGERPFPCPVCGKRFTKESVVKRHQTVHTGQRPHTCQYCYKTFSQQCNLKTHQILHFDVATGLLKDDIRASTKENLFFVDDAPNDNTGDSKDFVSGLEFKVTDERKERVEEKEEGKIIGKDFIPQQLDGATDIQPKPTFDLKVEYNSSDEECLSKVKENILKSCDGNGTNQLVEIPSEAKFDIKEEPTGDTADWHDDGDLAEEECDESNTCKDGAHTGAGEQRLASKLEKKRLKKLKKDAKKLKRKVRIEERTDILQIVDGEKVLFKCGECHYAVVNKRDLVVHLRSHSGEKLFSCDICEKKFSKQSVVKRHKLTHFGVRPFTCHLCGLTFTQSNSLKKHVETKHGLEETDLPYKCDLCPATFAQEKSLKTHKHVHLRKKNNEFTCHICGKIFPHECRLKSHLLLHEERQFTCDVCSKKFVRKYDLKYHLLIHTHEKQTICHICGGIFSTPATLKMHLRSHTAATQYPCDECHQVFKRSSELSHHKGSAHKGDKTFQCLVCDKFFSQASGLKKHQSTHSASKPYACQVCSKQFKLMGHMHKHYNTCHPGLMSDSQLD